jgi:transposase-like protein
MFELVLAGPDPDDLAREFEPAAQALRHWVTVADRRDGRREDKVEVVTPTERDELIRLHSALDYRLPMACEAMMEVVTTEPQST